MILYSLFFCDTKPLESSPSKLVNFLDTGHHQPLLAPPYSKWAVKEWPDYNSPPVEFLDVAGTKVSIVFLLAIHSHVLYYWFYSPHPSPLSKSVLKLVCNVDIVYGNLKSENSQDYVQKPQRNCTFMNSASGFFPGRDFEPNNLRSLNRAML